MSTVDTSSIFSATRKEVLLIFHKGVIEMNRGNGVPKIAAGQFAKVKHATATSPHIYGLVVAVAHTPESSGVPNFLGGVRVVLAMAVADRNATVATGDKGVEMSFWSAARSNSSQPRPITCTNTSRRKGRGRRAPST